jgi:hypothetical protein
MIDREHDLPIAKQAKALNISRGSVYYLPRPVPATDLEVMRRLDRLHLEFPFAGSRMLRGLLAAEGCKIGRRHVKTLMQRMGITVAETLGGAVTGEAEVPQPPSNPPVPRPKPQPIELHEPPTFIRFVWDHEKDITFHPQQRRYIRIETDANSNYHSPQDPTTSRLNIIVSGNGLLQRGSTPLEGGRMRIIFESAATAAVGTTGAIRVELWPHVLRD